MIATDHPNSRIVTVFRKLNFMDGAQVAIPEFMAMSKKSVGSFWENSGVLKTGTGLLPNEINLLVPHIVECEVADREFRAKASNFFASIRINVPFKDGKKLETGLFQDNKAVLSATNLPLNITEYVYWRFCMAHPLVGRNKAEADKGLLKEFYIFDAQAEEDTAVGLNFNRDRALEIYLEVKKDANKTSAMLTLLNIDPRKFKGKNAESLRTEALKKEAEIKPDSFVNTFGDKQFEFKFKIQTMVNVGILKKIGEQVVNPEDSTLIGHTMEEAVVWFKDPKNSQTVALISARMQEAMKDTLVASVKAAGELVEEKEPVTTE